MIMIEMMGDILSYTYWAVYGISMLFSLLIGAVAFVLTAIGLSRMAKACRYPRPWLAWIPLVNSFLIGKLAEISAVRFGKKKRPYGVWMLTLQIVTALIGTAFVGFIFSALMEGLSDTMYSASTIAGENNASSYTVFTLFPLMLLIFAVSIVQIIVQYIALHLVFKLFDENNALLYVILCVFVSYAMPVILLILSRKSPDLPEETPALVEALAEAGS